MFQAYILVQIEAGKTGDVVKAIQAIPGAARVDAVAGPYDIIVFAEAEDLDQLGRLIVSRIQLVPGMSRTMTCPVVHL